MAFSLTGEMPSKKNAWKRSITGRVYIPEDIKVQVDDFLWQLKPIKMRYKLETPLHARLRLTVTFYTTKRRDLDNMVTTLQDILQVAGVISNDNLIFSVRADKEEVVTGPRMDVEIDMLINA